jgi:hypothetical protein
MRCAFSDKPICGDCPTQQRISTAPQPRSNTLNHRTRAGSVVRGHMSHTVCYCVHCQQFHVSAQRSHNTATTEQHPLLSIAVHSESKGHTHLENALDVHHVRVADVLHDVLKHLCLSYGHLLNNTIQTGQHISRTRRNCEEQGRCLTPRSRAL